MAFAKYTGVVNFDDWAQQVFSMKAAGGELQATFVNGDEALIFPSYDGLNIICMLPSLGTRTPPEFTVSLADFCNYADPSDENDWAPFVAELRRVANAVESANKPKGEE
tara:strand:- start:71 stop:397 length:327 start_codon:yes stop_codon:yes gene_type:complete